MAQEAISAHPETRAVERADVRLYVSVDPWESDTVSRWNAHEWCVFVNVAGGLQLTQFKVDTIATGWDALAEIDDELWSLGLLRSQTWEIGSGFGFVAWLSDMRDEAAR